ncbi:winged helix-turn-helix transcriptional regulator [Halocatena halophila]|uniref:winged helix-turn-helix transcriptional regulator n=1 Tax=Halocatena halophila TaxID=2814576 RepID=UPI002ED535FF
MPPADQDTVSLLDVSFASPPPEVDVEMKAKLFELLGSAHMVPILHSFASDTRPRRFSEIQEQLDIPATTLTDRLQTLTDDGFIERTSYDEIPPRVEYTPTQKTADLTPVFEYLCRWSVHYSSG